MDLIFQLALPTDDFIALLGTSDSQNFIPTQASLLQWAMEVKPELSPYLIHLNQDLHYKHPKLPESLSAFEKIYTIPEVLHEKNIQKAQKAYLIIVSQNLFPLAYMPDFYFDQKHLYQLVVEIFKRTTELKINKLHLHDFWAPAIKQRLVSNMALLLLPDTSYGMLAGAGAGSTDDEALALEHPAFREKVLSLINAPESKDREKRNTILFELLFHPESKGKFPQEEVQRFIIDIILAAPRTHVEPTSAGAGAGAGAGAEAEAELVPDDKKFLTQEPSPCSFTDDLNLEALHQHLKIPGNSPNIKLFLAAAAAIGHKDLVSTLLITLRSELDPKPSIGSLKSPLFTSLLISSITYASAYDNAETASFILSHISREEIELCYPEGGFENFFLSFLLNPNMSSPLLITQLLKQALRPEIEKGFRTLVEQNAPQHIFFEKAKFLWEFITHQGFTERDDFFDLFQSCKETDLKRTLMIKIFREEERKVQRCLLEGTDYPEPLLKNYTINAAHIAALLYSQETLKKLAETTPHLLTQRTDMSETVIHFAARSGNLEVVKYLCDQTEVPLDEPNTFGTHPIEIAIMLNHVEIIHALLSPKRTIKSGLVDLNRLTDRSSGTRLFHGLANRYGDNVPLMPRVVDLIDPNIQNTDGQTILHFLLEDGHHRTFSVLLNNPQNVRKFDLSDSFMLETYEMMDAEGRKAIQYYMAESAKPTAKHQELERKRALLQEIVDLRTLNGKLLAEIEKLKQAQQEKTDSLLLKTEQLQQTLEKAQSSLRSSQIRIQELEKQLSEERSASKISPEMEAKIATASRETEGLKTQIARLESDYRAAVKETETVSKQIKAEKASLLQKLKTKQEKLNAVKSQTKSHSELIAKKEHEISNLRSEIAEAARLKLKDKSDRETLKRESDTAIQALKTEALAIAHQLETAQQEKEQMKRQIDDLLVTVKTLKSLPSEAFPSPPPSPTDSRSGSTTVSAEMAQLSSRVGVALGSLSSRVGAGMQNVESEVSLISKKMDQLTESVEARHTAQMVHLSHQMGQVMQTPERMAEETRTVIDVSQKITVRAVQDEVKKLSDRLPENISLKLSDLINFHFQAYGLHQNKRILELLTGHIKTLTQKISELQKSQPTPLNSPLAITSLAFGQPPRSLSNLAPEISPK